LLIKKKKEITYTNEIEPYYNMLSEF